MTPPRKLSLSELKLIHNVIRDVLQEELLGIDYAEMADTVYDESPAVRDLLEPGEQLTSFVEQVCDQVLDLMNQHLYKETLHADEPRV